MDRIYADLIRPKPTWEWRKGKNETKGIALQKALSDKITLR